MTMKRIFSLIVAVAISSALPAFGSLSFYAPYDNNLNLTVGSPSTPSVNGAVPLVTGYAAYGMPGNAAHFDFTSHPDGDRLSYGQSSDYFAGVGNAVTIGANSFRMLYKPDYSGLRGARSTLLGVGAFGVNDSFYLETGDAFLGPWFRMTVSGVDQGFASLNNYSWDANTWYYLGVSFDSTGSMLYVRPLTNNSAAATSTAVFTSSSWGVSGIAAQPVYVGNREVVNSFEDARGSIDDLKIFSGEKFSISDFHNDFAVVVPEQSAALLAAGALAWLLRRR